MKKSVFLTGTDQDLRHQEYIDLWDLAFYHLRPRIYMYVSLPSWEKPPELDRLRRYDIFVNISPRADLDLETNRVLREEIQWAEEHDLVIIDYKHSEEGSRSVGEMVLDLEKALGVRVERNGEGIRFVSGGG